MGYAKERVKFEKLLTKVNSLTNYDDKSLAIITDIYEQYSHTLRILKNKNPDTFLEIYLRELPQVKLAKHALKASEEGDRQDNFIKYQDSLSTAMITVIALTKASQ